MSASLSGSPAIGEVVAGRYRVEELLGEGGFGGVYRATQLNLDRQVALKVLHPELLLSDRGLERFRREARLAQSLEHPNTVRLYDFGQTEAGLPYIAWELLRGRPLDRVLAEDGPMPPARVARVASQVLKALMEAHGKGIVHRDIKPQNVVLADFEGEPDFVKVLDFGVAKPRSGSAAAGTPVTLQGEIVGTPSYMPPEQVRGEGVGPAVDLYALGLVMAELLSGEMVFRGGSGFEICASQLSDAPAPLPEDVLASPLGAVVARAVAKPLHERYPSAAAMLEGLEEATRLAADDPAWHRTSVPPRPGSGSLAFGPTQVTPTTPSAAAPASGPWAEGPAASGRVTAGSGGRVAAPPPSTGSGRPSGSGLSSAMMVVVVVVISIVLALSASLVTAAAYCRSCVGGRGSAPTAPAAPFTPFPPPASAEARAASARVAALAAGESHACAVLEGGAVRCWGANGSGQLGDGTTVHRPRPVAVAGVTDAVAVAVGDAHTCALRRAGGVLCWGEGSSGQLGTGRAASSATPAVVAGLERVRSLAAGADFTCAALEDGTARCWGSNVASQIGQASGMSYPAPVLVPGLFEVTAVAAGRAHACALVAGGRVSCWGANGSGQLGDAGTAGRPTPAPAAGLDSAQAIAAGGDHSCALLADGTVQCWGEGEDGELGRPGSSGVPAAFPVRGRAVAVSAGAHATCALVDDGSVACAGRNEQGMLGFSGAETIATPTTLPGLPGVRLLAVGGEYACAVTAEPGALCWGALARGTRGAEPLVFARVPSAVAFGGED